MSAPDQFETQRSAAAEFFGNTGTVKDSGNRSINKTDYYKFVKDNYGLEKSVLETAATADRAVIAGAIDVASAALKDKVEAAKKAAEDVNDLRTSVTVARPDGAIDVTVLASRTSNNPQSGQKTTTHGAVQLRIRAKHQMNKSQLEEVKDSITKAVLG